MQSRKLLINACARSGTKYIHLVWRKAGLDIGHEYVGADGTATHFFAVDAPKCLVFPWERPKGRKAHVGERRSDFEFENVWHQVRHPLPSITSAALVIGRTEWEWLSKYIPVEPRHPDTRYLSMKYWLHWNRLCEEESAMTYQIEKLESLWPDMAAALGVSGLMPVVDKQTNRNKRWAKPFVDRVKAKAMPDLGWQDLDAIDPVLADRVREQAARYGYEVS